LLFDATDIEQGSYFLQAIVYSNYILPILHAFCSDPNFKLNYKNFPEWQIIEWFRKQNS
jgi:hypothetical protein